MRTDDILKAYDNLSLEQMQAIEVEWQKPLWTTSGIATKLGLTREYVHSYIRLLNGNEAKPYAG
jgi:DNA-binding MarR family transcriptional regulator